MKYFLTKIAILGILISSTSCSEWLNLEPENQLVHDEFWKSKSEVEGVIASIYKSYRLTLDENVNWGDLRSDLYILTNDASSDMLKVKSLNILANNSLCKWNDYYKIINQANSVILMGPEAQKIDASFSIGDMNSLVAEAKFLRSMAYFYLVRTFKSVPLVTEPFITDAEPFVKAKSSEEEILNFVIADLIEAIEHIPADYESKWQKKGRATKWAAYALLADVYLWTEQYGLCVTACDNVINSGNFTLVPGDIWFEQFSVGNSDESIFELQYQSGQTNSFYSWFLNTPTYNLTSKFYDEGESIYGETDIRGEYSTFNDEVFWKYVGLSNDDEEISRGSSAESFANWIYYRLADVYLMKAEALAEQEDFAGAMEIFVKIRTRAGLTETIELSDSKEEYEDYILEERLRELAGEGKRWFDLLRTAKRNDFARQEMLINILLENVSAIDKNTFAAKLSDPNSYYLPIHETELQYNSELEQNPYYETGE